MEGPEWIRPDSDRDAVRQLSEELGCSHLLATVLVNRGITDPAVAEAKLAPGFDQIHPPSLLPAIDAATERVEDAPEANEKIAVFRGYRPISRRRTCAIKAIWDR